MGHTEDTALRPVFPPLDRKPDAKGPAPPRRALRRVRERRPEGSDGGRPDLAAGAAPTPDLPASADADPLWTSDPISPTGTRRSPWWRWAAVCGPTPSAAGRPGRLPRRRDVLGRPGPGADALAEPAGRRPLRVGRRRPADGPHRAGAAQRHPRAGAVGVVDRGRGDRQSGPHGIPAVPPARLAVDPRPRRHLHPLRRRARGAHHGGEPARRGRGRAPSAPAGIPTSTPSGAWWTTPCSPSGPRPPTCRRAGLPVGTPPVAGSELDFRAGRPIGAARLDHGFTDLARDDVGRAVVELGPGTDRAAAPGCGWTPPTPT